MAAAAVMPATVTVASAGEGYSSGGISSLAQREMLRRQRDVAESDRLRDEAREAYAEGDYKKAYDTYNQALQRLPNAPLLSERREFLRKSLADAAVSLSEEYRGIGKYDEARDMLETVVEEDPNNFDAKRSLEWLDDPIRTNPSLTEEHSRNVDKVRQGLYKAQGFYDIGRFDEAHAAYEAVLRIDPTNSAARRGMERVAQAKSDYYRAAYDQTRAQLLSQVDEAWELAVPPDAPSIDRGAGSEVGRDSGATYILQKLRDIVIPVIDFEDTSVEEAIDYLRVRSIELDDEADPDRRGINFFLRSPQDGGGGEDDGLDAGGGAQPVGTRRINELRLRNVPLSEALNFITEATDLRWSVDDFAVTIKPIGDSGESILTKTFSVPPDFLNRISSDEADGGGGGGGFDDPFAQPDDGGGSRLEPRMNIKEALEANGVRFPPDASAQFFAANSTLMVRNTPTNLDIVEQIVDSIIDLAPKQVKISTKFVEINQENTDELGFDWIVSPFGLNAASEVLLGGGTVGSGQARTNSDFIRSVDGVTIPGVPSNPGQAVSNIIGAGNRTGDGAIVRDSISGLLNNPNRASQSANAAPGILSLTGLFTDGQVQMIMRGLSQKKGTDLMTAPSVTARSGEKATIEIVREFIYPTEYEPPELPNQVGGNVGGGLLGGGGGGGQGFPVTPATPTAFETRNTGVTLEIAPNIGADNFVIDLNFAPEIVEFEGFVNYGSPIQSPSNDALGNPTTVTITENRIEMPVFSRRSVNTALTIFDGYTVAVGGLIREDVQNVEDKVPILGDIPFVGRLFQSNAENRIKSNLIIFVTGEIIDATGRRLNAGSEQPPMDGGTVGEMDPSLLPPMSN
jgi:general secretion pathway protein D